MPGFEGIEEKTVEAEQNLHAGEELVQPDDGVELLQLVLVDVEKDFQGSHMVHLSLDQL